MLVAGVRGGVRARKGLLIGWHEKYKGIFLNQPCLMNPSMVLRDRLSRGGLAPLVVAVESKHCVTRAWLSHGMLHGILAPLVVAVEF